MLVENVRPTWLHAALLALALGAALPGIAASQPARRGAIAGGVVGAGVVGFLGAALAKGICDAADCSDAWIDGAVPGVVFGGLGGALVGAAIGALGWRDEGGPRAIRPTIVLGRLGGSVNRLESGYTDRTGAGFRAMVGVRRGGLSVGPALDLSADQRWRLTSLQLSTRLESRTGLIRPFGELDLGHFSWRQPADLCGPPPVPNCAIRDDYFGAAFAVGTAIGGASGRWAVLTEVRFHFVGDRPVGTDRSPRHMRQLSVGLELALPRR